MERCMEMAEHYCKSYPRCNGCNALRPVDNDKTLLPPKCWDCPYKTVERAEQAFLKVREENKTLRRQLEIMTKDRDYYLDAYHHLLTEGRK